MNVQVAPSSAGGTPGSKTLTLVQTPSGQQILTTPAGDAAPSGAQGGKMIMVQQSKPTATATATATTSAPAPVRPFEIALVLILIIWGAGECIDKLICDRKPRKSNQRGHIFSRFCARTSDVSGDICPNVWTSFVALILYCKRLRKSNKHLFKINKE